MNRSCPTISVLLILCGLAAGIVTTREGLTVPASGLEGFCTPPTAGVNGSAASLLQYYGWLRSASAEARAAQYKCASSVVASGEPREKLVMALLLILPEAPFADFARAKVLLGEFLNSANQEDPEERDLAALMLALLDEITRLEAQLEQLKAIEKDITETEQSVNVPAPAPAPAPDDEHEEDDTPRR